MKKTLYFLCYSLFLFAISCKKKDACETKICQTNAVCNNGQCECENSFKVKNTCIPKDGNTFYYAGAATCYCIPDTFALIVKQSAKDAKFGDYTYIAPFSNVTSGGGGDLDYFKLPDGDSLRIIGLFDLTKGGCYVKDKKCTSEVFGKYKGTNQLDLTIRFFELADYSTTVDVCKIVMKK